MLGFDPCVVLGISAFLTYPFEETPAHTSRVTRSNSAFASGVQVLCQRSVVTCKDQSLAGCSGKGKLVSKGHLALRDCVVHFITSSPSLCSLSPPPDSTTGRWYEGAHFCKGWGKPGLERHSWKSGLLHAHCTLPFLPEARAHPSTGSGGKAHLLACALSWLDVPSSGET